MFMSLSNFLDPGAQRFKFTFTLRDTPVDYINVTCWGSEVNYINQLHASFKLCDIGKEEPRK
jgi:hypothetical protein